MSDFQLLLAALIVIYLADCCFWVRRGSVVMRSFFTRGCAVAHPSSGFGSTNAGVVPLNPLPPFGAAYLCSQWPFSLTPDAACAFVSTVPNGYDRSAQMDRAVRWDELQTVTRDGAALRINDRPFAKLGSEIAAIHFARLLHRLALLPVEQRGKAIDAALAHSMNLRAIERRLKRFQRLTAPLRLQAHLIALTLYGAVPITIARMADRRFLLPALGLLAALLLINAIEFTIAHRRLFYRATGLRYRSVASLIFSPPGAIRARDTLSRDLFAAYDPLAVTLVIGTPAAAEVFSRACLRDVTYPMQPAFPPENPAVHPIIADFHERYRTAVRALLERAGINPDDLLKPPPADETCKTYCPRCLSQFVLTTGICTHCGGIPLQPLEPRSQPQGTG